MAYNRLTKSFNNHDCMNIKAAKIIPKDFFKLNKAQVSKTICRWLVNNPG